jgi:hypothetical protein
LAPPLTSRVPPHELHIVVPAPRAGALGVGDLVMPDYVAAVCRDAIPVAQVRDKPRRGTVHPSGEPCRIVDVPFVLDAQRRPVHVPGASMPGDVGVVHALCYLAVRRPDDVVGRDTRSGRLEPVYGRGIGALYRMDHYPVYLLSSPVARRVVGPVVRISCHRRFSGHRGYRFQASASDRATRPRFRAGTTRCPPGGPRRRRAGRPGPRPPLDHHYLYLDLFGDASPEVQF